MDTVTSRETRSATEYHFLGEQEDAIIRATAYHNKEYDLSVISFPSRTRNGIRRSVSRPLPRAPNASLGTLDRLTLELLVYVSLHLDIYSLLKYRQTNLRSRQVIDSLQEYRAVTSHGLNPLYALLRTQLATYVSLSDFYNVLCTNNCAFCGEFGGFVFLPTWSRCCFECVKKAPETQMQTLASLRKQFRLTQAAISKLRCFKTLPGIYTMDESTYKSRFKIVPVHQAMLVSGKQPQAGEQPPTPRPIYRYNYMAPCALPYYERRSGRVEYGI